MRITTILASGQGLIGIMFAGIAILVSSSSVQRCVGRSTPQSERIFFIGLGLLVLSFFLFPLFLRWL